MFTLELNQKRPFKIVMYNLEGLMHPSATCLLLLPPLLAFCIGVPGAIDSVCKCHWTISISMSPGSSLRTLCRGAFTSFVGEFSQSSSNIPIQCLWSKLLAVVRLKMTFNRSRDFLFCSRSGLVDLLTFFLFQKMAVGDLIS